jgi:short-subunit dehydrogenase
MLMPTFALTTVDIPALPAEIQSVFELPSDKVIFDVGGDDTGAAALGRYHYAFEQRKNETVMALVVNCMRPLTQNAEDIADLAVRIRDRSRMPIDMLINNAGFGLAGEFVKTDLERELQMVDVNVKAPLILTSVLLPKLKEAAGIVINVSSVTARRDSNTHGAAYGATKAALTSFGTSLFEEVRKHGVRVVNLHPDLTATNLYRSAGFTVTGEPDSTLTPEDVADAAMFAIGSREGMCVTDITVRPQRNRIVKK